MKVPFGVTSCIAASFSTTPRQMAQRIQIPLNEHEVPSEPHTLFRRWVQDARNHHLPLVMSANLATAELPSGSVSSRQVQVTELDAQNNFIVFSNLGLQSRKGPALISNPHVALAFYWRELDRAVRIEGISSRMAREEDLQYFSSREPEYQISIAASQQSRPACNRDEIREHFAHVQNQEGNAKLKPPNSWGGIRITPHRYEFWQGRSEDLIHDRLVYLNREKDSWELKRLYP